MKFRFRGAKRYFKVSRYNYMFWLLMMEINRYYDCVYLFWNTFSEDEHKYNVERLTHLKNVLHSKIKNID